MKPLIIRLIIPLTIISFWLVSKWWYALPEDAPDTMYTGFPFIYCGPGWHTSLSFQIFVTEFIIDLLFYFACWLLIVFLIVRAKKALKVPKYIARGLWALTLILPINQIFLLIMADNVYHLKQPYSMKILETGIEFGWKKPERPDYYRYFPKNK